MLLEVASVSAGYGRSTVLDDVDLAVAEGEMVVLLGANGAGKTTLLRTVSGVVRASRGHVRVGGVDVVGRRPHAVARLGVGHVPQDRGTLVDLTVEENLLVGAGRRRDRPSATASLAWWYEVFPRLGERRRQRAGSLSGGEQQMLAVARALIPQPRLLLLDEPSAGLAPLTAGDLFDVLGRLNRELGTAMLVVEQNAVLALALATRAYVLEAGRMATSGPADAVRDDPALRRAYLG